MAGGIRGGGQLAALLFFSEIANLNWRRQQAASSLNVNKTGFYISAFTIMNTMAAVTAPITGPTIGTQA